jgi:serine/threonine-protein kinase/endoribonuclease IRE1
MMKWVSNFVQLKIFQDLLGPVPEGYESYFRARFPRLLIEIYKVLIDHCKDERMFRRYFAWSQA